MTQHLRAIDLELFRAAFVNTAASRTLSELSDDIEEAARCYVRLAVGVHGAEAWDAVASDERLDLGADLLPQVALHAERAIADGKGGGKPLVLVLPAKTGSGWFQELCHEGLLPSMVFLRGRLRLTGKKSPPYDSLLVFVQPQPHMIKFAVDLQPTYIRPADVFVPGVGKRSTSVEARDDGRVAVYCSEVAALVKAGQPFTLTVKG